MSVSDEECSVSMLNTPHLTHSIFHLQPLFSSLVLSEKVIPRDKRVFEHKTKSEFLVSVH